LQDCEYKAIGSQGAYLFPVGHKTRFFP